MPEPTHLIWSHEHDAWWRADAAGYTADILQAGIYTEEEASSGTGGSRIWLGQRGRPWTGRGRRRPVPDLLVCTGGNLHARRDWRTERARLVREIQRLVESRRRCPSKETDRLLAQAETELAEFDRRRPPLNETTPDG